MNKQRVSLTLDPDVYIHYRVMKKINLSDHINAILRFQMGADEDHREEEELRARISELEQERKTLDQEFMNLQSELISREHDRKVALKESEAQIRKDLERSVMVDETVKQSGELGDVWD